MSTFAVILAAAGRSTRFHDKHYKKPFVPLDNRAVWLHSAERFVNRDDVKQLIVVVSPEDRDDFMSKFGANVAILGLEVVEGGAERADSVLRGLERVREEIEFVVVHDAARPCLTDEWIDEILSEGEKTGAAILGVPVTSTLKRVDGGQAVVETVDRTDLWEAQTPQVFRRTLLIEAFAKGKGSGATDEAQLVEQAGHSVKIVRGSPMNIKITTRDDLRMATHMLKALPKPKAMGPAHPFADDDMWR